jgi:hypothetical protein
MIVPPQSRVQSRVQSRALSRALTTSRAVLVFTCVALLSACRVRVIDRSDNTNPASTSHGDATTAAGWLDDTTPFPYRPPGVRSPEFTFPTDALDYQQTSEQKVVRQDPIRRSADDDAGVRAFAVPRAKRWPDGGSARAPSTGSRRSMARAAASGRERTVTTATTAAPTSTAPIAPTPTASQSHRSER